MQTFNALVTRTDLTTMGLATKGSPATGNQIATKQFIDDNYFVDSAALSTYASNQCPPYQAILPFFPTYALATSGSDGGQVLASTNGGDSWSVVSLFYGQYGGPVKVSSSGQYQMVLSGSATNVLYLSYTYGSTWSPLASGPINDFAVSDNAQYIVYVIGSGSSVTNVYISNNSGASFSTAGSPGVYNWKSVAMSTSGQYITLTSFNSYIWVSSDYGVSFIAKTAYPSTGWIPVVMSQSGQYQVAGRGTIYRSSNYGSTWTDTGVSVTNGWAKLAISGDGQYLLGLGDFNPTELFRSTNYGASWSFVTAIGSSGNGNWRSIAIAADGVTQLVGASGTIWPTNFLYKSTNYGASFIAIPGTDWPYSPSITPGWNAVGLSNTVGTSTTTTSTTANPNYDYYLADEYNCSGCNITSTNVLVGFPTGTSVIINRFYADIGVTGFVYQITQSTSPGSPAVLLTLPSTTSCAGACSL
jgi:hypothetical protein